MGSDIRNITVIRIIKSSITLFERLATVPKVFSVGVMTPVLHIFPGPRGLAPVGGEGGEFLEVGGLILGKVRRMA